MCIYIYICACTYMYPYTCANTHVCCSMCSIPGLFVHVFHTSWFVLSYTPTHLSVSLLMYILCMCPAKQTNRNR